MSNQELKTPKVIDEERRLDSPIGIGSQNILYQPTYPVQEIKIQKVLNGFVLKVGCQAIVFEQKNQMLSELARYYDNPQAVEKEYMEKFK